MKSCNLHLKQAVSPGGVLLKNCPEKLVKIHRKTSALEHLFNKVASPTA